MLLAFHPFSPLTLLLISANPAGALRFTLSWERERNAGQRKGFDTSLFDNFLANVRK
jgi:hypothetical protein